MAHKETAPNFRLRDACCHPAHRIGRPYECQPRVNIVVRLVQYSPVASNAAIEFAAGLQNGAVRLLACHGQIQLGRGRRWFTALNHSTVLLAVAAWERYVESVLLEAFAVFDPGNAAPVYEQRRHGQRRGEIKTEIHKFGTPNAENTQRLFQTTLGVDPTTGWDMQVYGRTIWGKFTVARARTRLNEILQVRHSAAHGHAIPQHAWNKTASIGKTEALRIMQFLKELVDQTDSRLRRQLNSEFNIANAWSDAPANVDFSSI